MWYVCDVQYVRVNCFVMRGCAVSRRCINVCNSDVFSVVNMYIDHLKFNLVCINGLRYICCSECYAVSNECDEHLTCMQPIGVHGSEVMYFGYFSFMGELDFLDCDEICMYVVNKHFELLEFVFNYVYIDLKYNEIYLTVIVGSMCLCSHVVILGLSVRLSRYPMWVR